MITIFLGTDMSPQIVVVNVQIKFYRQVKEMSMSNIYNERILEDLFDKHLEIVERDFDLPEMVRETIARARARAEYEEIE